MSSQTLIDKKLFKTVFLFLILAEFLSFFAWLLPKFNVACFFIIIFLTLILSLEKLEYGIYILLAELFVGSKGYLFSLEFGQTLISIRIGLFLVVMGVWLYKFLFYHFDENFKITKRFIFLFLVIIWGLVWGLIRGNNFGDVFLDFNNWLYFLLIFPIWSIFNRKGCISEIREIPRSARNNIIKNLLTILIVCVFWISIKSLILLYIFSHQFIWALPEVYKWVRDTGVGEITQMSYGFYRIFIQSQIYSLLLFCILLTRLLNSTPYLIRGKILNLPLTLIRDLSSTTIGDHKQIQNSNTKKQKGYRLQIIDYELIVICLTTIILSFSRSYWLGLLISIGVYFLILIWQKVKILEIVKSFAKILLIGTISLGIIYLIIKLPPKIKEQNLADLINQRTTQIEAAGSSRISMLSPLFKEIIKHPIIGSGFGTTVTYTSYDPRILTTTAGQSGKFTTYAFEWGYLDMILKFGLVGLGVYLGLIYETLKRLFKLQTVNYKLPITDYRLLTCPGSTESPRNERSRRITDYLPLGFFLALISLLIVNIFSPYLNHPLGIGFIMLSLLITDR